MPNSVTGGAPNQFVQHHMLGPLAYLRPEDLTVSVLHVRDEKASFTDGGTNVADDITQTRTLNTVAINTIPGASLASNAITLPAGTYEVYGRAPSGCNNSHKAFFYNSTDAMYSIVGSNAMCNSTSQTDSLFQGQIVITAVKTFTVRHFMAGAVASTGLGRSVRTSGGGNISQPEIYTEVFIRKVIK